MKALYIVKHRTQEIPTAVIVYGCRMWRRGQMDELRRRLLILIIWGIFTEDLFVSMDSGIFFIIDRQIKPNFHVRPVQRQSRCCRTGHSSGRDDIMWIEWGPLLEEGTYPASIACNLSSRHGSFMGQRSWCLPYVEMVHWA